MYRIGRFLGARRRIGGRHTMQIYFMRPKCSLLLMFLPIFRILSVKNVVFLPPLHVRVEI
jgi:hypothetical protein